MNLIGVVCSDYRSITRMSQSLAKLVQPRNIQGQRDMIVTAW